MENYSNLEKLSNDLKNLFQNQNQNEKDEESYFDFEIICEQNKTSFKTHKSILSSRSEYFKSLFKSKTKELQEDKLILKDVSSSILSSILNYLYSGKIEFNSENAVQILIFSTKYLIDELIETSSDFIKNNLKFETVVDVLKLSESMDLNLLVHYCYQFILDHFKEFSKTSFFLELEENQLIPFLASNCFLGNEVELFQSIIKWGRHKSNINQKKANSKLNKKEKEKLQDQISNVIQKIRFIDFPKKELQKTLKEDLIPNQISRKKSKSKRKKEEEEKAKKEKDENENEDEDEDEDEDEEKENFLIFNPRLNFKSRIIKKKRYIQKLRKWINDDKIFYNVQLGFSTHYIGFSTRKWHELCDDCENTLVIIKTKDNFIFGGFTKVGFITDKSKWNEDQVFESRRICDPDAFLFSLRNDKNNRKPEKFPIKKGEEKRAIIYNEKSGPIFGRGDISFPFSLGIGRSNFGETYNLPKGIKLKKAEALSYLSGSIVWEIDEVETFYF
ncbi:pep-cterm sorting domain-containing protein [Anaeramoeba ignava]|uniref:Pep-cterm sorting domain-containing protein n=1 Tax=Anaeramoeba ignava TaxID=1746090 RepID=A0A9Q0LLP6_ANAIG|nr:pep-cterm sorting domain-containing protein [Anaeramoeba ignava]